MTNFTHSLAVVIGINAYANGIPRLTTAVNDATRLAELLRDAHGYETILLTEPETNQPVTRARLAALFTEEDQAAKDLSPALRERADVENAHGRLLNDTAGWTTITGIHNARGGERFVLIGNFHTCNSSTRIRMDGSKKASMERKASARMDEAPENAWGTCEGLVITRSGYARPCGGLESVEAAHPVPDQAGLSATRRMLSLVSGLTAGAVKS